MFGVAACTSRAQSAIIPRAGYGGAAHMRELLFCLHAALAALFLIGGVALAIESWFGGWGLGLILALATVNGAAFVILAMLFAATAMHLRRSGLRGADPATPPPRARWAPLPSSFAAPFAPWLFFFLRAFFF